MNIIKYKDCPDCGQLVAVVLKKGSLNESIYYDVVSVSCVSLESSAIHICKK